MEQEEIKNNTCQQEVNSGLRKTHVNILWTGGFDSSYRMIQLSKSDVTIQPYYLCDNRRSEKLELNAISAITADIQKHPETKCIILPLITFKVKDIESDHEITESFNRLQKLTAIGSQYDWLSRFAKSCNGLEMCLERSENGRASKCFKEYGVMKKISDTNIAYYLVDKEKSDPDLFKVCGIFRFPIPLFELTKIEILEEYKKLGFYDSMNKTWFCHTPVNNKACGVCNPCKSVLKEGLAFRLSAKALSRNKTEMKYGERRWYKKIKDIRLRIAGY
jgi:7-cyano-7-deazaguanine synthase